MRGAGSSALLFVDGREGMAGGGQARTSRRGQPPRERRADTLAAGTPSPALVVRVGEDRGRPALLVNGVVQSVAPAAAASGYWAAMLPAHRPRRALLLGFGGGTIAHLLTARFGDVPIVGVDAEPAVVAVARTAFGPLPPALQIVIADARDLVHGCAGRFDYVAVDLYHGADVPRGLFGQPFLRGVRAALTHGGLAVFNLFRDTHTERRLERLTRVLRVERQARVGDNVLVHCRAN